MVYSKDSLTYEAASKLKSYGNIILGAKVAEISADNAALYSLYKKVEHNGLADRQKISLPILGKMAAHVTIMEPVPLVLGKENPDEIDDARIRLMGSATVEFYGEATGQLLSENPQKEIAARIIKANRLCIDERNILMASSRLEGTKQKLELRAVYFPMTTDGINADQVFCHLTINPVTD